MALMSTSDQAKLAERFELELSGELRLRLRVHPQPCALCSQAEQILRETESLSGRVTLAIESGEGDLPDITIEGAARGEVRFIGLPSGYEFPGLIDSMVEVSSGKTTLSVDTVARLAALQQRVHIRVFTTPT